MTETYDDEGVSFDYPDSWVIEASDDGDVTTLDVRAPDGLAFALVTLDAGRPAPAEMADEALRAMRDEYPDLDASPARELIGGHTSTGYDVEFLSLDMTNSCTIRAFRTPRRSVLLFAQWSDVEDAETADLLLAIRRSLRETGS
jgi:hypothetical protein